MSGKPHLDFDVVREPWNKYELADGAVLKTKTILTKVRKQTRDEGGKQIESYSLEIQTISVILTDERGTPDTKVYSPQELQASIIKDDVRYTTLSEEWNEYVVDDGGRIRVKSTVARVSKSSKFDKNGEPVYWVESSNMAQIKPPIRS